MTTANVTLHLNDYISSRLGSIVWDKHKLEQYLENLIKQDLLLVEINESKATWINNLTDLSDLDN